MVSGVIRFFCTARVLSSHYKRILYCIVLFYCHIHYIVMLFCVCVAGGVVDRALDLRLEIAGSIPQNEQQE